MSKGSEMYDLAMERASHYAPPPKYEPIQWGFGAVAIVGTVSVMALGVYGVDINRDPIPFLTLLIVVFGVFFGATEIKKRRHYKAFNKEFEALKDTSDA
ncbi:MAG: hypothetical protein RIE84_15470 [Parvibaculum sp.]|jgi:hypothetical protein|uniref:hypothetical protein n=2 Tax=Parvibaculum sp. TaxID=2024848 RepID=UPI0032EE77A0